MIALYNPYYIIVKDNNTIYQIDIQTKQTIFTTNFNIIYNHMQGILIEDIFYWLFGNSSGTTIVVNIVTPSYSCPDGCTSCQQTYNLNTSTFKCDKIIYTLSSPNQTTSIKNTNNTLDWLQQVI